MLDYSKPFGLLRMGAFLNPKWPVSRIAQRDAATCREDSKIGEALEMVLKGAKRIAVVDKKGLFRGIVSDVDILDYLGGGEKHRLFGKRKRPLEARVSQIMSRDVRVLDRKTPAGEALMVFREHARGAHPVVQNGRFIGMVRERDFVRHVKPPKEMRVKDVMVRKPLVAEHSHSVTDVGKMLCRGGFRRLPVVEKGMLSGIVTPLNVLSFLSKSMAPLSKAKQPVTEVMTRRVAAVHPHSSLGRALEAMKSGRTGCLMVADEDELVGILTERDIVDILV